MDNSAKVFVMLPTLNEGTNISPLLTRLLEIDEISKIMVIDDGSTDGTAERARDMAATTDRVELVERAGKKGRGAAGREGFQRALVSGAEYLVEMDADLSHDPEYIPKLLDVARKSDLVVGSRFVPGGFDERRSPVRRLISVLARIFIQSVLGVKVKDPTSGFRCFTRKALERIDPSTLRSCTPSIVLESLYRAVLGGLSIIEVPIVYRQRAGERSKLTIGTLASCVADVVRLRISKGK
ncbi:MAG: polyprenol monophosphomannose synthase [Candidatus Omnitrophica bacterium]|nr:polyprenol monophosphomannose synthase [Candidatus Omnitrophota bacterium]